jgi:exopolyphosphatase/guanosine-5'-triphosphate,3'-diphosphate pyrophosphatase
MTVASIDIGTNTVLLIIAVLDSNSKKIEVLFDDQKIPRIGEGLKPGLEIKEVKVHSLLEVLSNFKKQIGKFRCDKILVTATNAFRIASNRDQLVELIKNHLGLEVKVVSGQDEARLTFLGCTFEESSYSSCAVIDIGGGSTEISFGTKGKISHEFSFPMGVVNLSEKYFTNDPPTFYEIENVRRAIRSELRISIAKKFEHQKTIAVAGTPTTLACIKKNLVEYDEALIEGEILTASEIKSFAEKLSKMSSHEILKNYQSVVNGRQDVLLAGIILLEEVMNRHEIKEVVVSSKGVRYGAIYDYLLDTT